MQPTNIILIEDNINAAKALRDRIKHVFPKSKIRIFASGEEALETDLDFTPDLALIDNSLEGRMKGPEVVDLLKKKYKEIKVIGTPLDDTHELRVNYEKAGADGFCAKTSGLPKMVETIEHL